MSHLYPVNQVFLGGDQLANSLEDKIAALRAYEEQLNNLKNKSETKVVSNWSLIDAEIEPLTDDQKRSLFSNTDYITIGNKLQSVVQNELLNLVKDKVEQSKEGASLLESQLNLVKSLKSSIVEESNREIELFKKFREFSKHNPDITYDEFIKSNI